MTGRPSGRLLLILVTPCHKMPTCQMFEGDCLVEMGRLGPASVDLVCCDLPYGSTRCEWDRRIDLAALWLAYRRVLKPRGAIVLNADFRLACELYGAAPKGWYRYDLVWDKVGSTGFLDSKRRPLRRHELMLVFAPSGSTTYNPQFGVGRPYPARACGRSSVYGDQPAVSLAANPDGTRCPTSIVAISNAGNARSRLHPTGKPASLTDWVVATYSNVGDTVLDNTAGSFTTGLSALTLGRNFIGIERDPAYVELGRERLARWFDGATDRRTPEALDVVDGDQNPLLQMPFHPWGNREYRA